MIREFITSEATGAQNPKGWMLLLFVALNELRGAYAAFVAAQEIGII